jgi:hypothetical protein
MSCCAALQVANTVDRAVDIQNSCLDAAGALDANFKGFGRSWYQSDLQLRADQRVVVAVTLFDVDAEGAVVRPGDVETDVGGAIGADFFRQRP